MKIILYMAMTANGMIARENDDTPWSKEAWGEYYKFVKQKKNIIVGRRTYEMMKSVNEFEKLNNPATVVLSGKSHGIKNNMFFAKSPKEAVELLKKKGFEEIVVGGGGKCNASFLESGLIDEIYLDIEPFVFGNGIRLFSEIDAEAGLNLIKVRKLSKNTLRLIYKVKKRAEEKRK